MMIVIVDDTFPKRCAGKRDKETAVTMKAAGIRNVDDYVRDT